MLNVIYVTPDVVGERMAGPGVRAWHIASELSRHFPTTLVAQFDSASSGSETFARAPYRSPEARRAISEASVLIGQPVRELLTARKTTKVVFDLFDPNVLELQELYGERPSLRESVHLQREWSRLRRALERGDLLMSATDRQRDFYVGVHAGLHRMDSDWLQRWMVVPFGVDAEPPMRSESPEREAIPTVLWGGGTWAWLDPVCAIEAVRLLNQRGVACRLTFLGSKRPNNDVPDSANALGLGAAVAQAGGLVQMNLEWVPYRERGKWLSSSKIAIMLHRRTAEAEYSIRTRLFDAIWAGLPVVATEGGFAAELVRSEGCGVVVRPADPVNVASALEKLIMNDVFYTSCVFNLERIRPRFLWEQVTRPLVEALERWGQAGS